MKMYISNTVTALDSIAVNVSTEFEYQAHAELVNTGPRFILSAEGQHLGLFCDTVQGKIQIVV